MPYFHTLCSIDAFKTVSYEVAEEDRVGLEQPIGRIRRIYVKSKTSISLIIKPHVIVDLPYWFDLVARSVKEVVQKKRCLDT